MPLGIAASCEACAAENRTATLLNGTGLERNLARLSALRTDGVVHLAGRIALVLASDAAVLAALWGAQVLRRIKFLFTIGEGECCTAIAARKLLISHNRRKKENKWQFLLLELMVTDRCGYQPLDLNEGCCYGKCT